MRRFGFLRVFGIVAAGWWIGATVLPSSLAVARAQDTGISDGSAGDEGPEDVTSSDANSASPAAKPVRVAGHWSGTIVDNSLGAGTLDLLIAQSKKKLSGGFDISALGSAEDLAGSLGGKASAKGITLTMKPSRVKGCKINAKSTSVSASEIKGSYSTSKCGNNITSGTFDVSLEHP